MLRSRLLIVLGLTIVLGVLNGLLTSSHAWAATKPSNTALPTISGTTGQGFTLTGTTGTWTGTAPIIYAYRWRRCNSSGASCSNISGATASTYLLVSADVNKTIRLNVTASNSAGSTVATSTQTALISAAIAPSNTALPVISGTAEVGQTLSSSTGTWNGSPTPTFTFQWRRCDSAGANCTGISGATNSTYAVAFADADKTLRVNVTGTNVGGSATATSVQTTVVLSPPVNTTPPTIAGTAQTGQTLTASPGTWAGTPAPSFFYQWRRCSGSCSDIAGANSSTYIPLAADLEFTLKVTVTASNSAGTAVVESAATVSITGGPPANVSSPQISGTPLAGTVLSSTPGTWVNTDSQTTYRYEWDVCALPDLGSCSLNWAQTPYFNIAPSPAILGKRLRVRVIVTNTYGSTTGTSDYTAATTATPALPYLSGSAYSFIRLSSQAIPQFGLKPTPTADLINAPTWENGPTSKGFTWWACDDRSGDLTGCLAIPATNGQDLGLPVTLSNGTTTFETTFGMCDYYDHYSTWGNFTVSHPVDYAGKYILLELTATNPSGTGHWLSSAYYYVPRPGVEPRSSYCPQNTDATLLARWGPELRYDSLESHLAVSTNSMTDNYQVGSYSNALVGQQGIIASSDPAGPGDALGLTYLGPTYPGGVASEVTDFINTADASRLEDAQRFQADPNYVNKAYGRIVREDNGAMYLQYWLFYYHNPKTFFTQGAHEGDWEMIQIYMSPGGIPINATYSQHNSRETCSWGYVQKQQSGRPVVYVAEGSHANYFTPGNHAVEIFESGVSLGFINDFADGARTPPSVPSAANVSSPPNWLQWKGRWGENSGSPLSPYWQQNRWSSPLSEWMFGSGSSAYACSVPEPQSMGGSETAPLSTENATSSPPTTLVPPSPTIRVRRLGTNLVGISYRFASLPRGGRKPWLILTSVDAAGTKYSPLTQRTRVMKASGKVVQRLGRGSAPFVIRAAALSRNGARSKITRTTLR